MEIDLGDTIGAATPADIEHLLEIVSPVESVDRLVLHLHDTQGEALACAARAIDCGIRRFDSACGGLGGCPFAPGAPGNLSTTSLLELCGERRLSTGVDIDAVGQTRGSGSGVFLGSGPLVGVVWSEREAVLAAAF